MHTRFLIYFFHFIIPENCSRSQEQEEYGRGSGEPYAPHLPVFSQNQLTCPSPFAKLK